MVKERKNSFHAIEHIGKLNELKEELLEKSPSFSHEDFIFVLKECGIPTSYFLWMEFRDSGLMKRVGKNSYIFSKKAPINQKFLQNVYTRYQKKINMYSQNKRNKNKIQEENRKNKILEAINLLKEEGYKIYKEI